MSESAEGWDGVERRAAQPLPAETVEVLTKTHEAIADVARAMEGLGKALVDSQAGQNRGMRVWMAILTVAVVLTCASVIGVAVLTLGNREQGRANFSRIQDVASCTEVGGDCFNRLQANEKVVTDADRQLLAQEIVCFAFGYCPPGMSPDNIPDLQGLIPQDDAKPVPGASTTTTEAP